MHGAPMRSRAGRIGAFNGGNFGGDFIQQWLCKWGHWVQQYIAAIWSAGRLFNLQNLRATYQSTQVRFIPDQTLRQCATPGLPSNCTVSALWVTQRRNHSHLRLRLTKPAKQSSAAAPGEGTTPKYILSIVAYTSVFGLLATSVMLAMEAPVEMNP